MKVFDVYEGQIRQGLKMKFEAIELNSHDPIRGFGFKLFFHKDLAIVRNRDAGIINRASLAKASDGYWLHPEQPNDNDRALVFLWRLPMDYEIDDLRGEIEHLSRGPASYMSGPCALLMKKSSSFILRRPAHRLPSVKIEWDGDELQETRLPSKGTGLEFL